MTPSIYLVQSRLGFQLSAYPHDAGLDEEVSADFLISEDHYRHCLNAVGGHSVYLDDETQEWLPLPPQDVKDPRYLVITYFDQREQALLAAEQLAQQL